MKNMNNYTNEKQGIDFEKEVAIFEAAMNADMERRVSETNKQYEFDFFLNKPQNPSSQEDANLIWEQKPAQNGYQVVETELVRRASAPSKRI